MEVGELVSLLCYVLGLMMGVLTNFQATGVLLTKLQQSAAETMAEGGTDRIETWRRRQKASMTSIAILGVIASVPYAFGMNTMFLIVLAITVVFKLNVFKYFS